MNEDLKWYMENIPEEVLRKFLVEYARFGDEKYGGTGYEAECFNLIIKTYIEDSLKIVEHAYQEESTWLCATEPFYQTAKDLVGFEENLHAYHALMLSLLAEQFGISDF